METFFIRNLGSEVAGVAGAMSKLDFTVAAGYNPNFRRQAVLLAACGSAPLYVKCVGRSGGAPTMNTQNWHLQVPSGQSVLVRATREVDLYLLGSAAYTALELG